MKQNKKKTTTTICKNIIFVFLSIYSDHEFKNNFKQFLTPHCRRVQHSTIQPQQQLKKNVAEQQKKEKN